MDWGAYSWTTIIAAAGRGTRLGSNKNKLLYTVGGQTILSRMVSKLWPRYCFVVGAEDSVILRPYLPKGSLTAIQKEPTGTADAVLLGLDYAQSDKVAVCWGSQVLLDYPILVQCAKQLDEHPAVYPVMWKERPYLRIWLDVCNGKAGGIMQAREGETYDIPGWTDCGVYFFRKDYIREKLTEMLKDREDKKGIKTGEVSFLHVLPLLEDALLVRASDVAVGIHDRSDVEYAEKLIYDKESCSV